MREKTRQRQLAVITKPKCTYDNSMRWVPWARYYTLRALCGCVEFDPSPSNDFLRGEGLMFSPSQVRCAGEIRARVTDQRRKLWAEFEPAYKAGNYSKCLSLLNAYDTLGRVPARRVALPSLPGEAQTTMA